MSGFYGTTFGALVPIYRLIGADFNSTADQALVKLHGYSAYVINSVFIVNSSLSMTTAAGGFYTGAAKSGTILVSASTTYAAMNAANTGTAISVLPAARGRLTTENPIFSLSTPQGVAATADIYIFGFGVL